MGRRPVNQRRYPRSARLNEVIREVVAEEVERLTDPRLGLVTVTGVDVSPDLRAARVFYSALGTSGGVEASDDLRKETSAALAAASPHIRSSLGRQVRLKYLPALTFIEDPALESSLRIEALLREMHERDMDGPAPDPHPDLEE